jgi:hypothetical protein
MNLLKIEVDGILSSISAYLYLFYVRLVIMTMCSIYFSTTRMHLKISRKAMNCRHANRHSFKEAKSLEAEAS